MPMALGWGAGAELRKPPGVAVVGPRRQPDADVVHHAGDLPLSRSASPFNDRPEADLSASSRHSGAGGNCGEQSLRGRDSTAIAVVLVCCSACRIGPPYQRPAAIVPAALKEMAGNDQWKMAAPSDHLPKGKWWTVFGDPQLDALEELVNTDNQSVKQAEAQFRQARRSSPPIAPISIPASASRRPLRRVMQGRTAAGWPVAPTRAFRCPRTRFGNRISGAGFVCRSRMR